MPTISMFFGILIKMNWKDAGQHNSPHFHAFYGECEAVFDFKPLLGTKVFSPLNNKTLFHLAKAEYGIAVWPWNIDICPDTLYTGSVPLE